MPRDLTMNVPPDLQPLIGGFLRRRQLELQQIHEAFQQGEFEAIAFIAHRLKGNGTGYGFSALTEIGGELERAALQKDGGNVSALTQELSAVLNHYQKVSMGVDEGHF
ncbi:MAG: Hpt domain-containing protein [Bdellovibrionales bacterium]